MPRFLAGLPASALAGVATGIGAIPVLFLHRPSARAQDVARATVGLHRPTALLAARLAGLVEPVAGTIGAFGGALATATLPWALGLAAGAMLHVISSEIVPETLGRGRATAATFALLGVFALTPPIAGSLG